VDTWLDPDRPLVGAKPKALVRLVTFAFAFAAVLDVTDPAVLEGVLPSYVAAAAHPRTPVAATPSIAVPIVIALRRRFARVRALARPLVLAFMPGSWAEDSYEFVTAAVNRARPAAARRTWKRRGFVSARGEDVLELLDVLLEVAHDEAVPDLLGGHLAPCRVEAGGGPLPDRPVLDPPLPARHAGIDPVE
jgi:hypothetical protein